MVSKCSIRVIQHEVVFSAREALEVYCGSPRGDGEVGGRRALRGSVVQPELATVQGRRVAAARPRYFYH